LVVIGSKYKVQKETHLKARTQRLVDLALLQKVPLVKNKEQAQVEKTSVEDQ